MRQHLLMEMFFSLCLRGLRTVTPSFNRVVEEDTHLVGLFPRKASAKPNVAIPVRIRCYFLVGAPPR